MPLSRRPQGWRARVWLLHLTLVVAAVIYAYYELWNVLSGLWRWVLLGWLIYSALTLPLTIRTMRRTFHTYWNAPTAAEKNREVAK
jgi:membrane protein implicated in regulation of membrane protease activity